MFATIESALVDWFKAAGVGVYLDGRGQHWRAEINGTDLSISELAASIGAKLPATKPRETSPWPHEANG